MNVRLITAAAQDIKDVLRCMSEPDSGVGEKFAREVVESRINVIRKLLDER